MIAYTFRIHEINLMYYQQIKRKWDLNFKKELGSLDLQSRISVTHNPHTKLSQYIEDNYLTISLKIALYTVGAKFGSACLCLDKCTNITTRAQNKIVAFCKSLRANDSDNDKCEESEENSDESDDVTIKYFV